jgi:hypothetical protein
MLLRRRITNVASDVDGALIVDVEGPPRRRYRLVNVTQATDGNFLVHPNADGEIDAEIEELPVEPATPACGLFADVFGSVDGLGGG